MAHFQVFVPEAFHGDRVTSHPLADVGLPDFVAGADGLPLGDGPDGGRGTLYAWRSPTNRRLHFNAGEQYWIPAAAEGGMEARRYWVGFWNDAPVTEVDLRRPYRHPGKLVAMGGEQWLFPAPRELPHDAIQADDGSWKFVVQREFHEYTLEVRGWVDRLAETGEMNITMQDMIDMSLRALRINYRMLPRVASYLRLFQQQSCADGFTAATGLDLEV